LEEEEVHYEWIRRTVKQRNSVVFCLSGDGESQCPLEADSLSGTLNLLPFCRETTLNYENYQDKATTRQFEWAMWVSAHTLEREGLSCVRSIGQAMGGLK